MIGLFAVAALIASAFAVRAALRNDSRTGRYLMCAGSAALALFLTLPDLPLQMSAVALLTIVAGVVMGWDHSAVGDAEMGESTLTSRRK